MKQLKIRPDAVQLLDRLVQKGYVIEDGKTTKALVYALKRAGVEVFNGYDQEARKVILALDRKIQIRPRKRTSKFAFFDIEEL